MTSAGRRAKVKEAMRRLPVLPEQQHMVDPLADRLVVFSVPVRVLDLPRTQPVGRDQALRELQTFIKLSDKLVDHLLCGMHQTTLDAMGRAGAKALPLGMVKYLDDHREIAITAPAELDKVPRIRKGAKPKRRAAAVTRRAAECFEILTGRRPTVTVSQARGHPIRGSWVSFLAEVFAALDIKGRPAAQAKAYGKKKKAKFSA